MSTETFLPMNRESITGLSQSRREPEWMLNLRLEALELAGTLELPKLEKTRIDRWNLGSVGTYTEAKPAESVDALPESARAYLGENNRDNVLVQLSSGIVFAQLSGAAASQGVIFTDLHTALEKHGDLVQKYFTKAIEAGEHRLTALHAAAWNAGAFLYVPRGVVVEAPIQALFVADEQGAALSTHVLIVAEEGSSVTYTDNHLSADGTGELLANGMVEVFVHSSAKVSYSSVHNMGDQVTDISYRRAIVEKDGVIEWVVGEMNNGNGVSDTTSVLKGDGSNSDAKVICVGTEAQKLNLTTRAIHFGKNSNSDMITRAVMRDEATAIINGITKIEKGATGANGQQTERVLMLNRKARGDANPILLIDEDDVKAGHAASVGQVNPEHIYYLMSRGISKEQAQKLIIYGFLAPVVSEIPIEELESRLQRVVERKLGQ
ncbi:FeS cluster assembly protein SufD [Paenibacillus sp. J31TS4]|uniref:Fe-S cluster assembly protein SufD n=1 Tax=Paenibacillus sp. J31TS4 TaxID=2807195 RepID=UPI001B1A8E7E|nr:Fe-S cluster assembly protein SufD [Paenibacillus sp. J31TS4]GIP38344.1 FeS cluster assembly protein SufD [Paenibacillus sp. J31TS4]